MTNENNNGRAIKPYFNMSAGCYCGLLLEKRLAKRMAKLLYKQQCEIQELLASNIEETEVADWTLAYPDNKQVSVHYFNPNKTNEDKLYRVKLFTKEAMIQKLNEVFIATNSKTAEYEYLKHYDKLEFSKENTND